MHSWIFSWWAGCFVLCHAHGECLFSPPSVHIKLLQPGKLKNCTNTNLKNAQHQICIHLVDNNGSSDVLCQCVYKPGHQGYRIPFMESVFHRHNVEKYRIRSIFYLSTKPPKCAMHEPKTTQTSRCKTVVLLTNNTRGIPIILFWRNDSRNSDLYLFI